MRELALEALLLPGHTQDGLGLFLPEAQTLLVGDYLSPCEIPFIEEAEAYHLTLTRLLALLAQTKQVIPGHGPVLSQKEAQTLAEEDLRYVEALLAYKEKQDLTAAEALRLPRAEQVPGMQEAHQENCRSLGLRRPNFPEPG